MRNENGAIRHILASHIAVQTAQNTAKATKRHFFVRNMGWIKKLSAGKKNNKTICKTLAAISMR
ncbi:MAG: hypothetical protein IKZ88_09310 [Neisseriaceae bacterium]|nr:hypothetical protein [Neisseriaceae bacterium]